MHLKRVDVNIRQTIRIKNVSFELLRETKKKTNCLSLFYQITWLFLVTTNWSKTIVNAKYKVAKFITKKKIPFTFFNFYEELVLAVVKCFCFFFNDNKKSCLRNAWNL